MIIAGFDVSTKTVGWGILSIDNGNISYIDSGYFSPLKTGSIFEKLDFLRKNILDILNKYNPDKIGIEDIIKFMKNKSTAQTTLSLAIHNRTVGLACYDWLMEKNKTSPEMFNVMTIRHGIKESKELPKKEMIPDLVAKHLNISYPWERSKSSKKNKNGKIKDENFDRADGIAVALYYGKRETKTLYKKIIKK